MCPKREDGKVSIEIKKNLSLPNAEEFGDIKRGNVSF